MISWTFSITDGARIVHVLWQRSVIKVKPENLRTSKGNLAAKLARLVFQKKRQKMETKYGALFKRREKNRFYLEKNANRGSIGRRTRLSRCTKYVLSNRSYRNDTLGPLPIEKERNRGRKDAMDGSTKARIWFVIRLSSTACYFVDPLAVIENIRCISSMMHRSPEISDFLTFFLRLPPPPVMWAQRKEILFVTICLEDCKDPAINIEPQMIYFKGVGGTEQKMHEVTINLYGEVIPNRTIQNLRGRTIELVLVKKEEGPYWPRLTKEKTKAHWLKSDFNKWKDEDDSDDEGGMEGSGNDLEEMMRQMGGLGGSGDSKPNFDDLDALGDEGDGMDSDDDDLPDLLE